jgi:hypothetical protein
MKYLRPVAIIASVVALVGLFGVAHSVFGSSTPTPKPSKGSTTPAATNLAPVELPIPLAVFDLTNKVIKDPFFPNTLRVPVPVPVTKVVTAVSPSCFALKALSGTSDQRLALINNRTLAVGESAVVTTTQCGKVNVTCVEIRESSVIIRIGSQAEPIEVFLPRGAR